MIEVLELLKTQVQSTLRPYPRTKFVPWEGGIPELWQDGGIETEEKGRPRIHRMAYERWVFQALHAPLRGQESWGKPTACGIRLKRSLQTLPSTGLPIMRRGRSLSRRQSLSSGFRRNDVRQSRPGIAHWRTATR